MQFGFRLAELLMTSAQVQPNFNVGWDLLSQTNPQESISNISST